MLYFPIFTCLNEETVLVVGGGIVAERKVVSLLSARANVLLVAKQLTAKLTRLVTEAKITWLAEEFETSQLNDVLLVIAATNDANLNQVIYQAARSVKRLVNVVDQPDLCNFIVPTLVNRNPVQVAITTGGTAPVLARRIKAEIEKMIPFHVGMMARIAGAFRNQVKSTLSSLSQKRLFWEKLFDGVFAEHCASSNKQAAINELKQQLDYFRSKDLQHQHSKGSVILVGAGPGDVGLLTLHALQAIQVADVVLYDALVSDEILNLVRKDAIQINVGKRARAHSIQQDETNQLLLFYAQKGLRVVRLKGGDPFVFGRGGEELQLLAANNIPFRVIPGITAALGATAYAGIPLTHRQHSQSVQFITGHCRDDGSDVEWKNFAASNQTLVIYMGTIHADIIAERLIMHGRSADTPIAIISNGTRKNQTIRRGNLKNLKHLADQAPTPAIIVIGSVANLSSQLDWFHPSE